MSGYAPNPTSNVEKDAASLTAGLLARKGEALPAVDADAHAGVDMSMHTSLHHARPPHGDIAQNTIQSLYPNDGPVPQEIQPAPPHHPPAVNNTAPVSAPAPATALAHPSDNHAPDNWTIIPPKPRPRPARRKLRRAIDADGGRKATITFRMSAKDFVRLRFASRDMEMTCQSILLDALDTYLDANDIAEIPDAVCEKEVERLMKTMGKARGR